MFFHAVLRHLQQKHVVQHLLQNMEESECDTERGKLQDQDPDQPRQNNKLVHKRRPTSVTWTWPPQMTFLYIHILYFVTWSKIKKEKTQNVSKTFRYGHFTEITENLSYHDMSHHLDMK